MSEKRIETEDATGSPVQYAVRFHDEAGAPGTDMVVHCCEHVECARETARSALDCEDHPGVTARVVKLGGIAAERCALAKEMGVSGTRRLFVDASVSDEALVGCTLKVTKTTQGRTAVVLVAPAEA